MPELTARGLSLLESIALHPEMTIKDHASEIGLVAIPNLIPSLKALEDMGFIQRWTSPKRRIGGGLYRQVNYQITPAGTATLTEAKQKAGIAAMALIGNFETKELYRVLGEALKDAAGR
jgi:DNA-binding MarR family transcriptional regulator